MMQNHFFDIPVYRLKEEQYYAERDAYIQSTMYPSPMHKQFLDRNPEHKIRNQAYFEKKFGGAWCYNEIIGWIELYLLGSQIRGEFWQVDVKRIVRSRKKTFEWQTHKLAPEIEIPYKAKNTEIFDLINKYLLNCQKELKNRYLDTGKFSILGPHIDWRSLLGFNQ